MYKTADRTVTLTEARQNLPGLIDLVLEDGIVIEITRHGRPVAQLAAPLARAPKKREGTREQRIAALREQLRSAPKRDEIALVGGGISAERAEELVAAIRGDRDVDVWDRVGATPSEVGL